MGGFMSSPDPDSFASPQAFREALRRTLLEALAGPGPDLLGLDSDYAHWPLGDADILEALQQAFRQQPRRQLRLIGRSFEWLPRREPRLERWMMLQSHRIELRTLPPERRFPDESLLLVDASRAVWCAERERWRGWRLPAGPQPAAWLRECWDTWHEQSEAARVGSALGL